MQIASYLSILGLLALSAQAQSINVTSTGVGVGTTAVTARLTVNGAGGNYGYGIRLTDGGSNYWESVYDGAGGLTFGRTAVDHFVLSRGGVSYFTAAAGNLGIGTTTPSARLTVNGAGGNYGYGIRLTDGGSNYWESVYDGAGGLTFGRTAVDHFVLSRGGVSYFTAAAGNLGIGTGNPTHKLTVNGVVKSKGYITDTSNWSDYVFTSDYKLKPLDEVEAHIKAKGHLPDVPSEAEIVSQGLDLGKMSATQMAQIEQLMLHVIALNKQVQSQAEEIRQLKATLSKP